MTHLKIHRVINEGWPRYHTPWITKFTEYLKGFFTVETVNCGDSLKNPSTTNLLSVNYKFGHEVILSDVDCIIENTNNQEYVVLSFTEYFNNVAVHLLRSDKCKKMLLTHFNPSYLFDRLKRDNLVNKCSLVSPWFFPPGVEYDSLPYRNLRKVSTKNQKLFFRGSGVSKNSYRSTVSYLLDKYYFLGGGGIVFDEYMKEIALSTIGLSHYQDLDKYVTPFDYTGEWCYRDTEYMSVGLPFIRVEFKDTVYDSIIPGKHYISIPREYALEIYKKEGDEGVSRLYEDAFLKYKDEEDYLEYISQNQTEWFDKNCRWPESAHLTWKLLNLDDWIK
jgi:hypothetical protein